MVNAPFLDELARQEGLEPVSGLPGVYRDRQGRLLQAKGRDFEPYVSFGSRLAKLGGRAIDFAQKTSEVAGASIGEVLEYPSALRGRETPTGRRFAELRGQGKPFFESQVQASRETTDLPRGVTGTAEVLGDPLAAIPGLGVLRGAKQLVKGLAAPIRKLPPVGPTDPVAKLTRLVRTAKPAREETEKLYTEERSRRAAQFAQAREAAGGRGEALGAQRALVGQLPRARFELSEQMAGGEVDALFRRIGEAGLRPFEYATTDNALVRLLAGDIPARSELIALEKVFGPDLVRAVLSKRSLAAKTGEAAIELANLPRSVMSSFDLSAPLRQGAVLGAGHPLLASQAAGTMMKALVKESWARAADDAIRNAPLAQVRADAGLYLADMGKAATHLAEREEAFMSRLAERIPGVRQSQRAYTTYLNKLRADVFDHVVTGWQRSGKQVGSADYQGLARFINYATGRGPMPSGDAAAMANATFFAPRLITSRLALPTTLIRGTALSRQEAARSLAAFIGTGTAILGLMKLAGADIETDPISPDFGRGRLGATRLDFWAGFQPVARYGAQIWQGRAQELPESGGQRYDLDRMDRILRFFWSKMAPVPGFAVGLVKGKDITGEQLDLGRPGTVGEAAARQLTPLFLQDLYDAHRVEGWQGSAKVIPAAFGASAMTVEMDALDRYWAAIENEVPPNLKPAWDRYFELRTVERKPYLAGLPPGQAIQIQYLLGRRERSREQMRRKNPNLDAMLVEEFGYSPLTATGKKKQIEGLRKKGIGAVSRTAAGASGTPVPGVGAAPVLTWAK